MSTTAPTARPRPAARTVAAFLLGVALAGGGAAWFLRPDAVEAITPFRGTTPLLSPTLVTVLPGVHLLGYTYPNAAYLVETGDGLVLVDTCKESDARPILRQLRTLGLDVAQLRKILLTHAHGDHALGAARLREMTGATVHAGRGDCGVLRAGGPREAFFSFFDMEEEVHPVEVDVELSGDEVIEQGNARFRAIAAPGHTPGSTCYLLERDGKRILFTGDVVMSLTDREPISGPGIYSTYLSPRFRGDAAAYLKTLGALRAMPAPDLVLPGHPGADPEPQSPRLPKEAWDGLLARAAAKMEALIARTARDGADFLDGHPRELLPGLHYSGEFGGEAVYGLTTADGNSFLVDAPGGDGLPAFLEKSRGEAGLGALRPTAVLLTSCAPGATAGLRAVVEKTGCAVVAPRAGIVGLRAACPAGTRFVAAEDLGAEGWLPVTAVPLEGLGPAAVAYALRWKDRTVVLSGRIPTWMTTGNEADVRRSMAGSGFDRGPALLSFDRLAALKPDLWLPAIPVNDQNANVYDAEWDKAVRAARAIVE